MVTLRIAALRCPKSIFFNLFSFFSIDEFARCFKTDTEQLPVYIFVNLTYIIQFEMKILLTFSFSFKCFVGCTVVCSKIQPISLPKWSIVFILTNKPKTRMKYNWSLFLSIRYLFLSKWAGLSTLFDAAVFFLSLDCSWNVFFIKLRWLRHSLSMEKKSKFHLGI